MHTYIHTYRQTGGKASGLGAKGPHRTLIVELGNRRGWTVDEIGELVEGAQSDTEATGHPSSSPHHVGWKALLR